MCVKLPLTHTKIKIWSEILFNVLSFIYLAKRRISQTMKSFAFPIQHSSVLAIDIDYSEKVLNWVLISVLRNELVQHGNKLK